MSVTYDAVGPSATGQGATITTAISWSHTCSGSNRLLTVGVGIGRGVTTDTVSVTYNSVTMTSAGRVMSNNQNDGFIELFYLVAPATGANTVAVTCSAARDLTGGSTSFNGVDQTTPISNVVTNFGSSAAPTITVSSDYGNMVVDAVCNGSNINSSNQELTWKRNLDSSSAAGNSAQSYAIGQASVTTTYQVSTDWWGIVGMNVNASPVVSKPKVVATYDGGFTTGTTPKTVSVTTQPGDIVVVYAGGESEAEVLGTPSGNGISFNLEKSIVVANFSTAYMWSGVDNTGGTNWTLTETNPSSSNLWGFGAIVFRNTSGVGASAKVSSTGTPASLDITTTGNNSAIVVFNDDWNAQDGASRTWNTVNGITPTAANLLETSYGHANGAYTAYAGFYNDAGTAGTKAVGISDPTGQKYSLIAVEILGPAPPATGVTIAWFSRAITPTLRASAINSALAASSLGVVIPSTALPGELLVLVVAQSSFSATLFNAIAGWTKQGEKRAGGAAQTIAVFTRIAQVGDAGTTVTSTSVNAENYTAQVRVYYCVDTATPMDATVVFDELDPAATTASAPAITTTTANATIVTVYSIPTTVGVTLTDVDWASTAAGFTNEVTSCTNSGSTNNSALAIYDRSGNTVGSQGPFSATVTDNRRWATATIAIRPAA